MILLPECGVSKQSGGAGRIAGNYPGGMAGNGAVRLAEKMEAGFPVDMFATEAMQDE